MKHQNLNDNNINSINNNNFVLKSVPSLNFNQTLSLPKIPNLNKQIKGKASIKLEILDNSNKILENIREENLTSRRKLEKTELNTSTSNSNNIKHKNKVNKETQTEEIFFKMPWTYFAGSYKILSSKNKHINFNKTMVPNILFQKFGNTKKKIQLQTFRNGFYSNGRNYNNTRNNFIDEDIKNLMSVLTFQNKNSFRNHNNNINYSSLTEKNTKSKSLENNNLKSDELKNN